MNAPLPGVWPHALQLACDRGLSVFPVAEGQKVPAIAGGRGCLDATTDLDQIRKWARLYPRANYGIATDGLLNIHVIDVDDLSALARVTARYGELPPTPTANTPRGRHFYFQLPAGVVVGNTASKLAAGVDTRGHNGYVVGPGSQLADGRGYAWVDGRSPSDVPFASLPTAIIAALRPPSTPPAQRVQHPGASRPTRNLKSRVLGYLRRLPPMRDGEGRNQTCFRLASVVMYQFGGTLSDANVACAVWNSRNSEPLTRARVSEIVANAVKYGGRTCR